MRHPTKWFVTGLAALSVAACGGGDGGDPEPTEDGLREAARAATEAFIDGETRSLYRSLTEDCQERLSYSDFAAQMALGRALFEGFLEISVDDLEVEDVEVRNVSDERGEARVLLRSKEDAELDLNADDDEFTPWLFEQGEWRSTDCDDSGDTTEPDDDVTPDADGTATEAADTPTETATPAVTGPGTRRNDAVAIGTPLGVGNWTIVVNSVTANANEAIAAENQFNDPPPEGRQFFLVNLSATFNGGEEDSELFASDISYSALGPSSVEYNYEDRCGVLPEELETFREVFEGGTITGNVCWAVTPEDAAALTMYADAGFDFEGTTRRWFSLVP